MTERYSPGDHAGERSLLVAASYVLLLRDGQVLLERREGTGYMDGFWATVAGHVDRGESVH
jgi:8-oxo-dGTP pyrophosphatase MutT (NUDIX family)